MNNNSETKQTEATNRGLTLMEQINAVLTAGEWHTPEERSNRNSAEVGTLSEYGKAIFTLRHTKSETLAQKEQELKGLTLGTEEQLFSSPFEQLFGGGLFDILAGGARHGGFGISVTGVTMGVFERLQSDSKKITLVAADVDLLKAEVQALKSLLSVEMERCVEPGLLVEAHRMAISPDFTMVRCACSPKVEQETMILHHILGTISKDFHVIHLPKDSSLIKDYQTLMEELAVDNVVCETGFIPDLQSDENVAMYFPKDLNEQRNYADVNADKKDSPAAERKTRVASLFKSILEAGTPYEAPKENVETPVNAETEVPVQ